MKPMYTQKETIKKSPFEIKTVGEAQAALRDCGILDKNNRVKKAYQGIIVKEK